MFISHAEFRLLRALRAPAAAAAARSALLPACASKSTLRPPIRNEHTSPSFVSPCFAHEPLLNGFSDSLIDDSTFIFALSDGSLLLQAHRISCPWLLPGKGERQKHQRSLNSLRGPVKKNTVTLWRYFGRHRTHAIGLVRISCSARASLMCWSRRVDSTSRHRRCSPTRRRFEG